MTDPKADDKGPSDEQKGFLKGLIKDTVNELLDERETKKAAAEKPEGTPEEKRTSADRPGIMTLLFGA